MPLPDHLKQYTRKCRACGKLLLFAVTDAGMRVPLDTVAPTFTVKLEGDCSLRAARSDTFVSHFATCPAANEFGRKAKAKGAP
jgi:hypothetical protein